MSSPSEKRRVRSYGETTWHKVMYSISQLSTLHGEGAFRVQHSEGDRGFFPAVDLSYFACSGGRSYGRHCRANEQLKRQVTRTSSVGKDLPNFLNLRRNFLELSPTCEYGIRNVDAFQIVPLPLIKSRKFFANPSEWLANPRCCPAQCSTSSPTF
jgi:hypothetical protein